MNFVEALAVLHCLSIVARVLRPVMLTSSMMRIVLLAHSRFICAETSGFCVLRKLIPKAEWYVRPQMLYAATPVGTKGAISSCRSTSLKPVSNLRAYLKY